MFGCCLHHWHSADAPIGVHTHCEEEYLHDHHHYHAASNVPDSPIAESESAEADFGLSEPIGHWHVCDESQCSYVRASAVAFDLTSDLSELILVLIDPWKTCGRSALSKLDDHSVHKILSTARRCACLQSWQI